MKYQALQDRNMNKILRIIGQAKVVKLSKIQPVSRDPNDDKFLSTAKAAHAHYLVSADKDLLDLKKYKEIKIIDAPTFLQILEKVE